jgi:hypothetical protein
MRFLLSDVPADCQTAARAPVSPHLSETRRLVGLLRPSAAAVDVYVTADGAVATETRSKGLTMMILSLFASIISILITSLLRLGAAPAFF